MDHNEIKACGMPNNVRHLHSPHEQDLLGKAKSFSDCCGAYSGANAGLEKQGHDSDHEIDSSKVENLPATQRKSLSYDNISTIGSINESGDHCRQQSFNVSASRNSVLERENCTEAIFKVHCNREVGDGNLKSRDQSRHSTKQKFSTDVCTRSDVSSETGESLNKENSVLLKGRMNKYCLNADEDKLGNVIKETCHDKQHKTESSSSNSTLTNFPASSCDSFQEMSVGPKKCNHGKASGMDSSHFTDLNCRLEECVIKSLVVDIGAQITSKDAPDMTVASSGKQVSDGEPSEIVDNVRARHCGKTSSVIADCDSVNTEMSGIPKTNSSKNRISELPNQDEKESFCEMDDALEVAQKVARELGQEDDRCKVASGSIFSAEERSAGMVNVCSVDFVDANERDRLAEIRGRFQLHSEKNECISSHSSKAVDLEMPGINMPLCLKVEDSSKDMGSTIVHVVNNGLQNQESSCPTMELKDVVATGQMTQLSRIDLNKDILVNEAGYSKQLVKEKLSKPIPVVGKVNFPMRGSKPQLQFEREIGGWKGAAATSAFHPISHSENIIRNKASPANDDNDSKHLQLKGIDLNVAVAGSDFKMDLLPQKCSPASSSLPSEVCSARAGRVCIDLNSVGENDDNSHEPSSPQPLSGHFIRDFDLNDQPMPIDECGDTWQQCQGNLAFQRRAQDDSALSSVGKTRQPNFNNVGSPRLADLPSLQSLSQTAFIELHTMEQMQRVVPLQHKPTYKSLSTIPPQPPPSQALTYNNGFFIDPNNHLLSAVYAPGVIPCIPDTNGVFPRMFNSGVHPAFTGVPQFIKVPGVIRPNFDINGGVTCSDNGTWGENGRQWLSPVSNAATDEQMKSVHQVSSSATPMKRREPEGGWNSHQVGDRPVTSWH